MSSKLKTIRFLRAFTLLELLVVITIIAILAGLVISTAGYVQQKAARSRAESEIAAITAACESYKADNGVYPTCTGTTDKLNPANPPTNSTATTSLYLAPSLYLYAQLSGDTGLGGTLGDSKVDTSDGTNKARAYMEFRPEMLGRADMSKAVSTTNLVTYLRDPFGLVYGYSTLATYNPTFDLWSTGGISTSGTANATKWITNWQ